MTLGDRLKATRQARHLTLAALAGTSGLTKGFISQLERGRSNPSLGSLGRIAASLGVPTQALLGDQGRVLLEQAEDVSPLEVFRSHDWSENTSSSVTRLLTARHVTYAAAHLAPGGALRPANGLPNAVARAFCSVLGGEVVFTQGSTEVILSQGDSLTWNVAQPYLIENRSPVPASLLIVVESETALPTVREQGPNYYDSVRQASSHASAGDGPLRLVALREQMRKQRGR